jgi:hypothetical protein
LPKRAKSTMEITIKYDPTYEYRKLLFNLHKVSINWYQSKGFVASHEIKDNPHIVIPEWEYLKTHEFWNQLSKIPLIYSHYPYIETTVMNKLFELVEMQDVNDILAVKNIITESWKGVENDFLDFYQKQVDKTNTIKTVELYMTAYGTSSVYSIGFGPDKSKLYIFLRQDQDVSNIARCILSGYFSAAIDQVENNPKTSYTWEEKNRIIDYYFINTKLKDLFPNYKSLVEKLRSDEIKPSLIEQSNKIYAELGFPLNCEIKIQNNQIKYADKYIVSLTKSEKSVLFKLIKSKGEMISYDQIAEVLWGEDYYNFFSLKAVNKIVERIKTKLKNEGIHKEIILNKRGVGYVYLG